MNESHLRNFYFQLRNLHLNPAPPTLCNTDGDPLEFQDLEWRLEVPVGQAVDALLPLAKDSKEQILAAARRDEAGLLTWVELPWVKPGNRAHQGMESTLLGRLVIEPAKLTAAVNSQKRATRLKKEVLKRLGAGAAFERATIESFESRLKTAGASGPGPEQATTQADEVAMERALEEAQRRHWDAWINEPLTALGGLTPEVAVKVKNGKEMVEALLFGFEEGNRRSTKRSLTVPVEDLRRRLKL